MGKIIPRLLALVSMVLAAVVALSFSTCTVPVLEESDGGDVQKGIGDPAITSQEEEEPEAVQKVLTWEDVGREIQDSLSDSWPTIDSGQMYDPASVILRFAEDRDMDPVIAADEYADLANTILDMQPDFVAGREGGFQRALLVALDIYRGTHEMRDVPCAQLVEDFEGEEGQVPRINAYVMAAMGYRESRFMERTERGYLRTKNGQKVENCRWCRGSLGEQGMFQFMPNGWAQAQMPRGCSPFDRMCSVRGAAKTLAVIRCMCIEQFGQKCTVDSYVAGYGAGKVPDPAYASGYKSVVRARGFLCEVRQDCDDFWPRDSDEDFALTL